MPGIAGAQAIVLHAKAFDLASRYQEGRQAQAALRLHVVEHTGEHEVRERADVAGHLVVAGHEALDPLPAAPPGVAQRLGDIELQVEGQPVLTAPGVQVQVEAHGPEEGLRRPHVLGLRRGQQAVAVQRLRPRIIEASAGNPIEGVQVTQAADPFLDVGFQRIAAVAGLEVALAPFLDLVVGELAAARPFHHGADFGIETAGQCHIAANHAVFDHRREGANVVVGLGHALAHGPDRLPDLEARIPEHVEQGLDRLGRRVADRVLGQEQQVDIGKGGELPPAIATQPDQAHGRAAAVGQRVLNVLEHPHDHHVGPVREALRGGPAVVIPGEQALVQLG